MLVTRPSRSRPTMDGAMNSLSRTSPSAFRLSRTPASNLSFLLPFPSCSMAWTTVRITSSPKAVAPGRGSGSCTLAKRKGGTASQSLSLPIDGVLGRLANSNQVGNRDSPGLHSRPFDLQSKGIFWLFTKGSLQSVIGRTRATPDCPLPSDNAAYHPIFGGSSTGTGVSGPGGGFKIVPGLAERASIYRCDAFRNFD
jgi:hypothetical protein